MSLRIKSPNIPIKKLVRLGVIATACVGVIFGGYFYYKENYAPGWHEKDGKQYYIVAETRENATGLKIIDGTTYLFDSNGNMLTGWQEFEGYTFYFADDGIMQKGRTKIGNSEYYLDPETGVFYTGRISINGVDYFYNKYGFAEAGFITVDGVTSFYD
ncbi:MAG: hypothetical protein GX896_07860, partial [Clostridiales bacterium]|nr:hypothetical protein [Clostridiales bacterium]